MADILATMKNGVVITRDDLEKAKERFFQKNPRMKNVAMDNPDADFHFLEGLIMEKVVGEYIVSHKINETTAYKNALHDAYELAKNMINSEFFSQQFNITISDEELKNVYDTHEDSRVRELPYESIKDKLKENLYQAKLYELYNQKFQSLKKEYGVELKENLLNTNQK